MKRLLGVVLVLFVACIPMNIHAEEVDLSFEYTGQKIEIKNAEKYFTQIEEQKDDENAAAQNETDEMAGKEQIEKRLDGAKLIESETKTVTPDEDGTFTYQAYRPAKAQLK